MPELTVQDGKLVDGDGKVFGSDDDPIKLTGVFSQADMDKTVQERLGRQSDKLGKQIEELKKQAEHAPGLQTMVNELTAEKDKMEKQLVDADTRASQEVQSRLRTAQQEAKTATEALKTSETARASESLNHAILSSIHGPDFNNASADVLPQLRAAHKREKNEDGQLVDVFEMTVFDEAEKASIKALNLSEAIEAFKANPANAHYLAPHNKGGSGGAGSGGTHEDKDLMTQIAEADKAGDTVRSIHLRGKIQDKLRARMVSV